MFKSGKKLKNRKAKAFKGELNLIQNFKKMEEANALCYIKKKREVHLINKIFWQGKIEDWKINFLKNLHFLMERHLDQSTNLPIHIHAIDPDTKVHSRFAIYQPIGNKIILD